MSHLHDMEELVISIEDLEVKDYMKEAMSCYMTGAYRACIVLTYIALFDDIVKKLGELGKVNNKAKVIHNEATKRMQDQNVFESYLIDQLKSNALLPALDVSFLEILRVLRNKSAHTSGHNASAEEARFIFFEAINRFLSKSILTTTQLVDELLSRLDEKHFFPSSDISKISSVVRKELINIHHEAFPYLINKFLEKEQSTNADISKNAGFFLTGLAAINGKHSPGYLKKYVIDMRCADSKFSLLILRLISANGILAQDLDAVTYERLRCVISDRIENVDSSLEHTRFSHPASFLKSILTCTGEDFIIGNFEPQLKRFFQKNIFSNYFIAHLKDHKKVIDIYFEELCSKAGSSDFDTANHFARNMNDIDIHLSKILSPVQAFTLVTHILASADGGAWGPQSLRGSKFSSIPGTKALVSSFVKSDEQEAREIFSQIMSAKDSFEDSIKNYINE